MFRVNHRAEYDDVDGDDLKKPLVYGKKNQITLYFLTNVWHLHIKEAFRNIYYRKCLQSVYGIYALWNKKAEKRRKGTEKTGHPPSFVMIMMQYLWNNFTVNMRSTVLLCYLRLRGDFPKSKTAQCEIFFRSLFTLKFRLLQFCSACHVCVDIIIQFLVGESSSSRANIEVNINYFYLITFSISDLSDCSSILSSYLVEYLSSVCESFTA